MVMKSEYFVSFTPILMVTKPQSTSRKTRMPLARYPKIIEGFWNVIDAANKCDKTDKDRLYQSILDSMKQLVNAQGKSFLPHDVKKAMNEIEGYFNIELTVW